MLAVAVPFAADRPAVVGVYITVELTRGRIAAYWATGCGPLTVEKSSVVGPTKHK